MMIGKHEGRQAVGDLRQFSVAGTYQIDHGLLEWLTLGRNEVEWRFLHIAADGDLWIRDHERMCSPSQ